MPEGEVLAIGLGMEQRKMLLLGCLLHGHRPPSLAPYLGGQGIGPNQEPEVPVHELEDT